MIKIRKVQHSFYKPTIRLGIHKWYEGENKKDRAISIFWGFGLLTIYYK